MEPNFETARKLGLLHINGSFICAVHGTVKLAHRSIVKRRKELWNRINMCKEERKEQ